MELVLVDTRSGKRRTIALGPKPALLGSGVDCDVVVPSAEVAEHACTASLNQEGIVLEALGGTTFVLNERPSKGAILHPGDVVKLGPFQLVPAGFERPPEPAPRAPVSTTSTPTSAAAPARATETLELTPAELEAKTARAAEFATRRRNRRQSEVVSAFFVLLLLGAGTAVLWQRGVFSRKSPDAEARRKTAAATGSNGPASEPPQPADATPAPAEPGVAVGDPARVEPTSPAEVTAALAKVDQLLKEEEFACCRWLLWQLAPTGEADRARIEKRRAEVDAAAKKGGEAHLAFVDELVKKGKLPAALSQCEEESIERFRGLPVWYRLLEKADEVEALLSERVSDSLRPKPRRKHTRPMPADLASRPPPPATVTRADDFNAVEPPAPVVPHPHEPPARAQPKPDRGKDAPPATPPSSSPVAPSAEQLALQAAVTAALHELAAAKPSAVEASGKKAAKAVHSANELAVEPLLARCEELATALENAPERAALAELRRRVQALAAARGAAIEFIFDEQRYPMLDPRAPGDVNRGDELAKAQKEADRLVDAVRAIWGSEQGSAPAPIVAISEETSRLVEEARLVDGWLSELGRTPPDRAELLATRLLPSWSSKLSVRNYAVDLDDRRRIDADREVRSRNQLVKETKDADELELLNLTNTYRELLGRPQLAFDRRLYAEARNYATLMAAQSKGAKESDPQPEPTPRIQGTKPSAGANYLRARASPRQALQSWCKLAGTHRNLLDRDHRAVAAANVGNFWAQQFGLLAPVDAGGK